MCRDPSAYLDLTRQSVPVANLRTEPTAAADDADAAAAGAEALPLFGAVRRAFVTGSPKAQSAGKRRRGSEASQPAGGGCGAVLYAGGPVWALDWSPAVALEVGSGGGGGAAAASSRQDDSGASEPYSSQFLAVRISNPVAQLTLALWRRRCKGCISLLTSAYTRRDARQRHACRSQRIPRVAKAMSLGERCTGRAAYNCGKCDAAAAALQGPGPPQTCSCVLPDCPKVSPLF